MSAGGQYVVAGVLVVGSGCWKREGEGVTSEATGGEREREGVHE